MQSLQNNKMNKINSEDFVMKSRLVVLSLLAVFSIVMGTISSDSLAEDKTLRQQLGANTVLEHFNIFCSSLGRREDKAGKEDCAAILKYCEQI